MSLSLLAALSAARRHWTLILVALALLVATGAHVGRLSAERALEHCRGRLAVAALRLERLNQAAAALRRDSARRATDQAERLREARRANEGQRPAIERLQQSASTARGGEACTVSEALKEMEKQL